MCLWTQADFLSLAGGIILQLSNSILAIEWFHVTISFIMVLICIYFSNDLFPYKTSTLLPTNSVGKCTLVIPFFIINTSICIWLSSQAIKSEITGIILGWITSFIYIFGRFPQIYKNWQRKTTEGLSILMYVFTVFGNLFYLLSILEPVNSISIVIYLPWITLVSISILLDFVIFFQWKHYSKFPQEVEEEYGNYLNYIKLDNIK
jgi:uncharacterized protein with PQ loop repeat